MIPSYVYEVPYILEEVGELLIPALLSGIPSGLFGIVAYVLTALALHTVAKRRGISNPWLAWIPVANWWLLGSLSDQYRYVVKGQFKSKRKALIILKLISLALTVAILVCAGVLVFGGIRSAMYGTKPELILESRIGMLLGIAAMSLPLAGVAIAATIIRYIALYDIYTSCDPDNNVLFIVLSILFGVTEPFFLFFSRNKDLGMPPRREETTPPPSYWEREETM